MEPPHHSKAPLLKYPLRSPRPYKEDLELIAEAAKYLRDRDITIIEYGEQLMHRIGYPVVLQTVEWVVSDDQLSLASRTLLDRGFLLAAPSKMLEPSKGEWETKGLIHNINGEYFRFPSTIHLYPLSFVIDLTLEDTVEARSVFDLDQIILTPKSPNFMLSLIRYFLKRPINDINRIRVQSDLIMFIRYTTICPCPRGGKCTLYENQNKIYLTSNQPVLLDLTPIRSAIKMSFIVHYM